MDDNSLQDINKRLKEQRERQEKGKRLESDLERIAKAMITAMKANIEHRENRHDQTDAKLAEQQESLSKALTDIGKSITKSSEQDTKNLETLRSSLEGFQQAIRDDKTIDKEKFVETLTGLLAVSDSMTDTSTRLEKAVNDFTQAATLVSQLPEQLSERLKELNDNSDVVSAIEKIDVNPSVNVTTPEVEIDTKAIEAVLEDKLDQLSVALSVIQDEKLDIDTTPIEKGLEAVRKQIQDIIFPVPQFPTKLTTLNENYATRVDDTTTANTTYIGNAIIGSGTDEAVWQIYKLDTSSGMVKTWADGNADFDNVWDDRATLTYN